MSIINLVRRRPQITEEQIQKAQDCVDRWVAIKKMMATNGWHFLKEDLNKEIKRLDTIKGVTPETLEGRTERLEGVDTSFAFIRGYERAAIESEKILALVAAQTKES